MNVTVDEDHTQATLDPSPLYFSRLLFSGSSVFQLADSYIWFVVLETTLLGPLANIHVRTIRLCTQTVEMHHWTTTSKWGTAGNQTEVGKCSELES